MYFLAKNTVCTSCIHEVLANLTHLFYSCSSVQWNRSALALFLVTSPFKSSTNSQTLQDLEDLPLARLTTFTLYACPAIVQVLDEIKRSLHDALCVTRNLVRDNAIVYGKSTLFAALCLSVPVSGICVLAAL
jgi:hypothetical protein